MNVTPAIPAIPKITPINSGVKRYCSSRNKDRTGKTILKPKPFEKPITNKALKLPVLSFQKEGFKKSGIPGRIFPVAIITAFIANPISLILILAFCVFGSITIKLNTINETEDIAPMKKNETLNAATSVATINSDNANNPPPRNGPTDQPKLIESMNHPRFLPLLSSADISTTADSAIGHTKADAIP